MNFKQVSFEVRQLSFTYVHKIFLNLVIKSTPKNMAKEKLEQKQRSKIEVCWQVERGKNSKKEDVFYGHQVWNP